MEAFLHIGTPKTGTSSIQTFLAENGTLLTEHGLLYPLAGRTHGEQSTVRQVGLALSVLPVDRPETGFDRIFGLATREHKVEFKQAFTRQLETELHRTKANRIVISDEGMYSFLSRPHDIRQLGDFLRPYFDRIRIVVYLRAPESFVESFYSQHLKMGGIEDLGEFAQKQKWVLSYGSRLKLWQDAFGRDSLVVREFSRPSLHHGDIVSDFFKTVLDIDIEMPPSERQVNTSITPTGQALLLRINRHFAAIKKPRPGFFRQYVSRNFAGPGQRLSPDQVERLYAALGNEIDAISTTFFGGRRIFDNPPSAEPTPAQEAPAEDDITDAAIEMSIAALRHERKGKRKQSDG